MELLLYGLEAAVAELIMVVQEQVAVAVQLTVWVG
jgi:hypothetical protein